MSEQMDMLRDRSARYLKRIREYQDVMQRCADKLEVQGNQEPDEVAAVLRQEAERPIPTPEERFEKVAPSSADPPFPHPEMLRRTAWRLSR